MLQSSGLSPGSVSDAGSGLFALIWWLLTPLIVLWNVVVGFLFASPPTQSEAQSGGSLPPGSSDSPSKDNAADSPVRRRVPGYVVTDALKNYTIAVLVCTNVNLLSTHITSCVAKDHMLA